MLILLLLLIDNKEMKMSENPVSLYVYVSVCV